MMIMMILPFDRNHIERTKTTECKALKILVCFTVLRSFSCLIQNFKLFIYVEILLPGRRRTNRTGDRETRRHEGEQQRGPHSRRSKFRNFFSEPAAGWFHGSWFLSVPCESCEHSSAQLCTSALSSSAAVARATVSCQLLQLCYSS